MIFASSSGFDLLDPLVVYGSLDTIESVRAAVLAERERCAKIVETWGGAPPNQNGRRDALAAKIREG
jgi:hypothetical protein